MFVYNGVLHHLIAIVIFIKILALINKIKVTQIPHSHCLHTCLTYFHISMQILLLKRITIHIPQINIDPKNFVQMSLMIIFVRKSEHVFRLQFNVIKKC